MREGVGERVGDGVGDGVGWVQPGVWKRKETDGESLTTQ